MLWCRESDGDGGFWFFEVLRIVYIVCLMRMLGYRIGIGICVEVDLNCVWDGYYDIELFKVWYLSDKG